MSFSKRHWFVIPGETRCPSRHRDVWFDVAPLVGLRVSEINTTLHVHACAGFLNPAAPREHRGSHPRTLSTLSVMFLQSNWSIYKLVFTRWRFLVLKLGFCLKKKRKTCINVKLSYKCSHCSLPAVYSHHSAGYTIELSLQSNTALFTSKMCFKSPWRH